MDSTSPRQYDLWMRRAALGGLHLWAELWVEPETLPEYPRWVELSQRRGRAEGGADLRYSMTRGLLWEVIYAAGGVESEFARLEREVSAAQEYADRTVGIPPPDVPTHLVGPSVQEALYAFVNVLTWARAVRERVDRPFTPGQQDERTGLLRALAPSVRGDVAGVLTQLDRALGDEARSLANYALHAGALHGGGTPAARVERDGRVSLPLPDRLASKVITTWEEFTYQEGRDMLTYAREVTQAVERFVEETLAAFERARPARAGPLPQF